MSGIDKSIQEKINELNELVSWFDGDDFAIEEALERFNKAEKLAEDIEKDLNEIKNEVSIIKQKFSEAA